MKPALKSVACTMTLGVFALLAVASGGKKTEAGAEGGTAAATSNGPRTVKASCNHRTELGTCTEYPTGSSFTLAQGFCGMIDAGAAEGWGTAACPQDRVVGKCVTTDKDAFYKDETEIYYAPEYTAETAEKHCKDSLVKGKVFTAGTWKPAEGEARAHCVKKIIGSKNTGPDECEEHPYGASTEEFAVIKMNCSAPDTLVVGKACPKELKDAATSKCEEKNGTVRYNQPTEAKNAKDMCESDGGKYTKLGAAPAAKAAAPKTAAPKKK